MKTIKYISSQIKTYTSLKYSKKRINQIMSVPTTITKSSLKQNENNLPLRNIQIQANDLINPI